MIRVETDGSYWEIDEALSRYRRWPKHEGPRPNDWGKHGKLQDLVWHDCDEWYTIEGHLVTPRRHVAPLVMIIRVDDGAVVAPNPIVLRGELAHRFSMV
jgi:hypothetical protein